MRLPELTNFRDAGGIGSLRPGLVFRSAELSRLSDADGQALLDLGVTDVFDLRTWEEIEHRPDRLPAGIRLVVEDVLADRPHSGAAEVASLVNQYAEQAGTETINAAIGNGQAAQHMHDTYLHLVTLPSADAGYRSLFTELAHGQGGAVIHCTAGKDRTGWALAVLQLLGGATREEVVADYLGSNEPMRLAYGPMLDGFAADGGDADALEHMMLVFPEYLETALEYVDRVYGGVEGYLQRGLGLSDDDMAALRTRLLR